MSDSTEAVETQRAWLLNFGKGYEAAVAFHEMSRVIMSPSLISLPCTPGYCNEALLIGKRILPVLSIVTLLEKEKTESEASDIVGIAIYQEAQQAPLSYVGLYLAETPSSILVNDNQACALPEDLRHWESLAQSCFLREGKKIPVLDLVYLFSAGFREKMAGLEKEFSS
ncbi:MAG: hypothetical protein GY862_19025 [Gammaproteobacteria bacterium]|nr:hypothetical protein [Gammaproteobacteria bacterium]